MFPLLSLLSALHYNTFCWQKQPCLQRKNNFSLFAPYCYRGDDMASYVAPGLRDKFESLSTELKDCILARNVKLNTLPDLIRVLEEIVREGEG